MEENERPCKSWCLICGPEVKCENCPDCNDSLGAALDACGN